MSEAISVTNTSQLLSIIKRHPKGLSEYQLLTLVYEQNSAQGLPNLRDSLVLFQQHFCLFHSLYLLREGLHRDNQGTLLIDVLNIQWLPAVGCGENMMAVPDSLREYYLNTENLCATSRDQVEALLDGFWCRMLASSEQTEALETLGLAQPVSWPDIKKRYRQCLSECHPDRGGSHDQAVKYNQAIAVLERCYG
ncbi:DNA-J related domain-containing protein [Halioxenophilus aromaticivorans]|uniref:DNA-J related domain-containing protein n=1 Tax=Halioxenophilus aromaticivorans TaxID=1306992 RepID=A0AAV3U9K6_9ALTE